MIYVSYNIKFDGLQSESQITIHCKTKKYADTLEKNLKEAGATNIQRSYIKYNYWPKMDKIRKFYKRLPKIPNGEW